MIRGVWPAGRVAFSYDKRGVEKLSQGLLFPVGMLLTFLGEVIQTLGNY